MVQSVNPWDTFVFGKTVDLVLAFCSGFTLSVLGVVLTAVSVFSWAAGTPDICLRSERRVHATLVTGLSILGAAGPLAFAILYLGISINLNGVTSALVSTI
jgi:hypothetical protein